MKFDHVLVLDRGLRAYALMLEVDPLTEGDALPEAQLLDVRFDAEADVLGPGLGHLNRSAGGRSR